MIEVIFKAKRLDTGEWVEGYLVASDDRHFIVPAFGVSCVEEPIYTEMKKIITSYAFEVDPETVCRYTGLKDKNRNEIWENDILKGFRYPYLSDEEHNYFAEVTWFDNCPAFGIYIFKNPKSKVRGISEGNTEFMEEWNPDDWEVIGNIFDNPELLEV